MHAMEKTEYFLNKLPIHIVYYENIIFYLLLTEKKTLERNRTIENESVNY